MVYPGGVHSRFEHVLGTMHVAGLIAESIAAEADSMKMTCNNSDWLACSTTWDTDRFPTSSRRCWTTRPDYPTRRFRSESYSSLT